MANKIKTSAEATASQTYSTLLQTTYHKVKLGTERVQACTR